MSSQPEVILYHYNASPFATKVKNLLLAKGIPHKRVATTMAPPRPELSDLLGITYRRIPLLAIGNDVYCDTSLIASVLERRFPASQGYNTLFPARAGGGKADTGLTKALVTYWSDGQLFRLIGNSLPYAKLDASFIKDRSAFFGGTIDAKKLAATQGERSSALSSHLNLLEEQLSDGRQWLLDTESIGLADISVQFLLNWALGFKNLKELFDEQTFGFTLAWLARASDHLAQADKAGVAKVEKISGTDAAKVICSSSYENVDSIGFDTAEANRLGVKQGDFVSIVPTDLGKVPTLGRLIALSKVESVIVTSGSAGQVHCHFPRLEFSIRVAKEGAKL
ncbi:hypothetical protein PHLGIDRAFT_29881 [Phlebiopsis gigantea 11061_1 CR5-6]|uniref:GST N-terminal domain-containing protein n=1 Tax=Phlebiopsis gigantea (strain 11061_1 CR5-6) TaxID=745531 RepID=A0A0C3S8T1_PHLG1|nr:hypothetical protein PHLGIDRAFT_29881 [Phlebiopsis gigantea 11061_1 CR5-6]